MWSHVSQIMSCTSDIIDDCDVKAEIHIGAIGRSHVNPEIRNMIQFIFYLNDKHQASREEIRIWKLITAID